MPKNRERVDYIPVPRKLQDIIPVRTIYPDGIFELINGRFSKSWLIDDVNYAAAGKEEKKSYANKYAELLSGMDSEAMYEITVNRRKLNFEEYKKNILLEHTKDGLDEYRDEYNEMISDIVRDSNMMFREIYITVSISRKKYADAKSSFDRIENNMSGCLGLMRSGIHALSAEKRLNIFYDFYRDDNMCNIDLPDMIKTGRDVRTYICPETFECDFDRIKMGKRFTRVLILRDVASYVKDDIIQKITDIKNPVMISTTIDPVPTDLAVEEVEQRLMKVEKNIDQWKQKQHRRKMPYDEIPYDYEMQRKEVKGFLDELVLNDMKMMYATITVVHSADTEEELDADTEQIRISAKEALCQISVLEYRQLEGLQTALPWGLRGIDFSRTMLTGSMLAFTPFFVQEMQDFTGVFYGKNHISRNIILSDKEKLKNANMMLLAVPGSGKSVMAKNELAYNILKDPDMDVIIIDPEREYGPLVEAFKGTTVKISAGSENRINLMDINEAYSIEEEKPIVMKSQFILSVCEQIMRHIDAREKSIIDRCVRTVYREYIENGYSGEAPTLKMLYEEIIKCPEHEARDIALAMELFVSGSLNVFSHDSNINTDDRIMCYDLYDMDDQLMPVGMLVVLDNILNRVTRNRYSGRKTTIIIEELYLYLMHEYSANFLYTLWKRIRKYNGYCIGITQNVRDLRNSSMARTMLSNSEFVCLLSQAEDDLDDLKTLLKISDEQINYVRNADQGCGLFKIGKTIIPFENRIPKDTKLYRLMTTKPKEVQNGWKE